MKIKLGDKLNLALQLHGGPSDSSYRVFCTLEDQSSNEVAASFEIPHDSAGLFQESSKTMPDVEALFAKFEVRESDGSTVSSEHNYVTQRFDIDKTLSDLQDSLSTIRKISTTIEAVIPGQNIEAIVNDESIEGEL